MLVLGHGVILPRTSSPKPAALSVHHKIGSLSSSLLNRADDFNSHMDITGPRYSSNPVTAPRPASYYLQNMDPRASALRFIPKKVENPVDYEAELNKLKQGSLPLDEYLGRISTIVANFKNSNQYTSERYVTITSLATLALVRTSRDHVERLRQQESIWDLQDSNSREELDLYAQYSRKFQFLIGLSHPSKGGVEEDLESEPSPYKKDFKYRDFTRRSTRPRD